jgi:uncharacterized damage-inducible protein DinB
MTRSLLADAFDHHVWATLRLLDTCLALDPTQLETTVPGTYGSILSTMRHIVGADASYLFVLTEGHVQPIEEDGMDLPQLRAAMVGFGPGWSELLAQTLDPDEIRVRHRDDGSEFYAPLGIRLAQVPHHGTDHRSQICTALTALGIEPPLIDVWDFAEAHGRTKEIAAPV